MTVGHTVLWLPPRLMVTQPCPSPYIIQPLSFWPSSWSFPLNFTPHDGFVRILFALATSKPSELLFLTIYVNVLYFPACSLALRIFQIGVVHPHRCSSFKKPWNHKMFWGSIIHRCIKWLGDRPSSDHFCLHFWGFCLADNLYSQWHYCCLYHLDFDLPTMFNFVC